MNRKFYVSAWLILVLSTLLILPGCMNVSSNQDIVQNTNSGRAFGNKKIAILPVKTQTSLAPDSVLALRAEVNKGLGSKLQNKLPSAIITDVAGVADQLNQTNTLTIFEQLISTYENTGVMDKRHVTTLGNALSCDYILLSRLKSEKIDIGFITKGVGASLEVMLISTSSGKIDWAGSGEWKRGGVLGQGGASFSELSQNIINLAFESLQTGGEETAQSFSEKKVTSAPEKTTKKARTGSNKVVALAQKQLLDLGYEPGPADGRLGKGTEKALRKFQQENDLAETGQIDQKTIDMLKYKIKEKAESPENQLQTTISTTQQAENVATQPVTNSRTPASATQQELPPVNTISPTEL